MAKGFAVDTAEFRNALRRLAQVSDRTQGELLQRYARTTLSNRQGTGLLQITPPGGAGATGLEARRQGEAAIDRDLSAIFVPKRLKHQRKERWPDVAGIHAARFRSGSRFNGRLTRGQSQPYYVDVQKVRALRRLLFARVGTLASGLLRACRALSVAVPAWISRHGTGRGEYTQQLTGPRKLIEIVNHVSSYAPADELARRTQNAVNYATARIERETAELIARDAQRSGFKSSA